MAQLAVDADVVLRGCCVAMSKVSRTSFMAAVKRSAVGCGYGSFGAARGTYGGRL